MLDLQHLDDSARQNVQIFYGKNNATTSPLTDVWEKPRGISMVQIFMLGQGGLGASGSVGATATGGQGGGSGGITSLLFPAIALPDILYVGGGSGTVAAAINTYVAVKPHGATFNSVPVATDICCTAFGANGVTGATAAATSNMVIGCTAFAAPLVSGLAGGAGGAVTPTAGTASGAQTSTITKPGGGGGGMSAAASAAGGNSTTSFPSWYPTALGGAGGTSGVDGGAGGNGIWLPNGVRCSNGGAGGGSGFPTATASNGGNGGTGGYGSGGGGGGGAVTGKTAGVGGRGGAGIVIITCW